MSAAAATLCYHDYTLCFDRLKTAETTWLQNNLKISYLFNYNCYKLGFSNDTDSNFKIKHDS